MASSMGRELTFTYLDLLTTAGLIGQRERADVLQTWETALQAYSDWGELIRGDDAGVWQHKGVPGQSSPRGP